MFYQEVQETLIKETVVSVQAYRIVNWSRHRGKGLVGSAQVIPHYECYPLTIRHTCHLSYNREITINGGTRPAHLQSIEAVTVSSLYSLATER